MKGDVREIYKAFDGIDKSLVIPVYQRNYDWTVKQCEKLFDDIQDMIELGRPRHFFGAIVGYPEDSFTWVVIDGQQRLTTVSLLTLALVHAIEAGDIVSGDGSLASRLMRNYLESDGGAEQKFKLKPVKNDRDAYARLFGPEEHFNEKSKVTANYRYFRERLRDLNSSGKEISAKTFWDKGISQLEVMLCDLEPHDNPQRIFESLNSTGLALKESDKVRNFVLMDLKQREQNEVYEKYWNEMEKNVGYSTDEFIRGFLVAQTNKTPNRADVYEAFKTYAKNSGQGPKKIAETLHEFSIYSREIENAETGNKGIDRTLRRVNLILSEVAKPLVWLCYRDLKQGVIDAQDFQKILEIIESFLFRRVISNLGTNSLNKIFSGIYNDLRKLRKNEEPYSEIFAYLLLNRRGGGRFPDDGEFKEAFQTKDVYSMRNYRSYYFDVLELGFTKDVRDIAAAIAANDLTVEHIMPQTLSKQWREALGPDSAEIHSVWVNRAANLTITGYNSEYSNRPFIEKKKMEGGFEDSPYLLNRYVKKQDQWGLEQLEERNELLAERALECWPFPSTSFQPEKEVTPFEPVGEDRDFRGRAIVAVELEGTKYPVKSWAEMTVRTVRMLLEQDRAGVLAVADVAAHLDSAQPKHLAENVRGWRLADPALAVYVATPTRIKMALLRRICRGIGYDPDEILVYLRPEHTADSDEEDKGSAEASPYAELVALRPLLDELVGTQLSQADMADEVNSLKEAVAKHAVENPAEKIGGLTLEQFLSSTDAEKITADQALACLSLYLQFAQMMGNQVWRGAILKGEISTLLGALSTDQ